MTWLLVAILVPAMCTLAIWLELRKDHKQNQHNPDPSSNEPDPERKHETCQTHS